MKFLSILITTIIPGLISLSVHADSYNFKAGLWETTTTMEVKGVPAEMAKMMQMPTQVDQDCVQKGEVMFESDKNCQYEKTRVSANKLLVKITCSTPEGITNGKGEVNFNGKTTNGFFAMNVPRGPFGPLLIKNTFKARYLGSCK